MKWLLSYALGMAICASVAPAEAQVPPLGLGFQIQRGYFSFGDHEVEVKLTSSADFEVCIWARNVDKDGGGVQVITPMSQFRGAGSTGPIDGLVMNVAGLSSEDLGCLGGKAGEEFSLSGAGNARVTVFLTVRTAPGAAVSMMPVPRRPKGP